MCARALMATPPMTQVRIALAQNMLSPSLERCVTRDLHVALLEGVGRLPTPIPTSLPSWRRVGQARTVFGSDPSRDSDPLYYTRAYVQPSKEIVDVTPSVSNADPSVSCLPMG